MKLKKFAAVAMAAVMSVAMLTACSGGGGGVGGGNTGGVHGGGSDKQYRLSKLVAETEKTGKLYMEGTADITKNGNTRTANIKVANDIKSKKTCSYVENLETEYFLGSRANSREGAYWWSDGKGSTLSGWTAEKELPEEVYVLDSTMLDPDYGFWISDVKPEYQVGGRTYYAEIVRSLALGEPQDIAYCFDGDTLKYIVTEINELADVKLVERVTKVSASIPDEMKEIMDAPVIDLID